MWGGGQPAGAGNSSSRYGDGYASPGASLPSRMRGASRRLLRRRANFPKAGETPPSEADGECPLPHAPPRRSSRFRAECREHAAGQSRRVPGPELLRPNPAQRATAHRRESALLRRADDPEDPRDPPRRSEAPGGPRPPSAPPRRATDACRNRRRHRKTRVLRRVLPRTRKDPKRYPGAIALRPLCGRGSGDPGRIRTCGLRIRNPPLYPTELRGRDSNSHLAWSDAADRSRPSLGAPASRRHAREARENVDAGETPALPGRHVHRQNENRWGHDATIARRGGCAIIAHAGARPAPLEGNAAGRCVARSSWGGQPKCSFHARYPAPRPRSP